MIYSEQNITITAMVIEGGREYTYFDEWGGLENTPPNLIDQVELAQQTNDRISGFLRLLQDGQSERKGLPQNLSVQYAIDNDAGFDQKLRIVHKTSYEKPSYPTVSILFQAGYGIDGPMDIVYELRCSDWNAEMRPEAQASCVVKPTGKRKAEFEERRYEGKEALAQFDMLVADIREYLDSTI